jgi:hypothetical protein
LLPGDAGLPEEVFSAEVFSTDAASAREALGEQI